MKKVVFFLAMISSCFLFSQITNDNVVYNVVTTSFSFDESPFVKWETANAVFEVNKNEIVVVDNMSNSMFGFNIIKHNIPDKTKNEFINIVCVNSMGGEFNAKLVKILNDEYKFYIYYPEEDLQFVYSIEAVGMF